MIPAVSASRDDRQAARNVLLLTGAFLTCLWGFFAYWTVSGYRDTMAASQRSLEELTSAVNQYVVNLLKMAEVFQTTAERWTIQNSEQDPRMDPGFVGLIDDFRQRTHGLIDVRMATSRGDLFYFPNDPGHPKDNVADREYFQAVIHSPAGLQHVGIPVVSRVSKRWRLPLTVRMARPVHDLEVINASVDLSELIGRFESQRPKPHGTITLLRTDGVLLARAPEQPMQTGKRAAADWADWPQISDGSGVIISARTPYDGTTRLISYQRVPDLPLVVLVTATRDDVLAAWRKQTLMAGILLVLVTLGGGLFSARLLELLHLLNRHVREQERLAVTDSLTGLYNRRHLMDTGKREMVRALRYGKPLSLIMLDIDHFKLINDTWGHQMGDRVLKGLADTIATTVREQDTFARIGGEEFAIVLPETDLDNAHRLAERIRSRVEGSILTSLDDGYEISITISLGMTTQAPHDPSFETLMSRADRALYRAKESGRNRSVAEIDTTQQPG